MDKWNVEDKSEEENENRRIKGGRTEENKGRMRSVCEY